MFIPREEPQISDIIDLQTQQKQERMAKEGILLFPTCVHRTQIWVNSFPIGKFQNAMYIGGRRLNNLQDLRQALWFSAKFARWRFRPISAVSLLAHEIQKQIDGFILTFEMFHLALPSPANPAPGPGQASFTKQRAGDFHGVIAGHVFRRLSAFDIDVVRLRNHGASFGIPGPGVQ